MSMIIFKVYLLDLLITYKFIKFNWLKERYTHTKREREKEIAREREIYLLSRVCTAGLLESLSPSGSSTSGSGPHKSSPTALRESLSGNSTESRIWISTQPL